MRIFQYWGKARSGWHLLPYHSLDVAACAVVLFNRRSGVKSTLASLTGIGEADLVRCLGAAAAMHDLGKLSPSFQEKVPEVARALRQNAPASPIPNDVRHDSLGWALWKHKTHQTLGLDVQTANKAHIWIQCATGHHGQPPALYDKGRLPIRVERYFTDEGMQAAVEWAEFVTNLFDPPWKIGELSKLKPSSWWIAGLINLADWLGSSTEWFPYVAEPEDLVEYWETAKIKAAVAADESGLCKPWTRRSFFELFPDYSPSPAQSVVTSLPLDLPFFLAIEESTGGGKTEAALAAAGGDAFFFGLPTMATANGLWNRLGVLDGQQTLIHAKRWLLPEAMVRAAAWINDSSRKAVLSNIGVGTIDQAMLAVLFTRFNVLRVLGLAGRTLIIDEVHAYDPYMTRVIERLIEFHARAGGAVVLLSATMPVSIRQRLCNAWRRGRGLQVAQLTNDAFPIISHVTDTTTTQVPVKTYASRTIRVVHLNSFDECVRKLYSFSRSCECAVWIRNTVREASEAYEILRSQGVSVTLFHARFAVADRLRIEKEVLQFFGKKSTSQHRSGKILIATQVVEQSLDLDFDQMISDIAPIDLIIQRAGRLQRHERGERGQPCIHLHLPPWEEDPPSNWISGWSTGTARVYPDHSNLWLSAKALGSQVLLPQQSREVLEMIYGSEVERLVPVGLMEHHKKATDNQAKMANAAGANLIGQQFVADNYPWTDEIAPTRLGEPSIEWVICESGVPLHGDVEQSVVSLRASTLLKAPHAAGVDPGSWRRTLNLSNGIAHCEGINGKPLKVRYTSEGGLEIA